MKNLHLFAVLVSLPLFFGGCGGKAVAEGKPEEPVAETAPGLEGINFDELEEREGVHYLKGSDKPYKGKVFRLYKNGQKKIEANMKDGKPDGLTFGWHENGKKMQEVKWNEGKAEGLATWWYESGQKKLSGTFKEGKRHGLWTWWDEGGQKKSEISFIQGKAEEGSDVLWDGQVIRYKAEVKNEEPVAETKQVEEKQQEAEREKKREQMLQARFSRGLSNNDSKRRVRLPPPRGYKGKTDNSRKEAKKREGVNLEELEEREGIMYLKGSNNPYTGKSFFLERYGSSRLEGNYKDGKIGEENYKDGKMNGLQLWWHRNGQKQKEENYNDGKLVEGSTKYWNNKGERFKLEGVNILRLNFRGGLAYIKGSDVPYTGKVFSIGRHGGYSKNNYKDGKPDGLVVGWHANGQKSGEGNYKDGKMNGLWMAWYENGQKKSEANYKDGKLISAKAWNSRGERTYSREEAKKRKEARKEAARAKIREQMLKITLSAPEELEKLPEAVREKIREKMLKASSSPEDLFFTGFRVNKGDMIIKGVSENSNTARAFYKTLSVDQGLKENYKWAWIKRPQFDPRSLDRFAHFEIKGQNQNRSKGSSNNNFKERITLPPSRR